MVSNDVHKIFLRSVGSAVIADRENRINGVRGVSQGPAVIVSSEQSSAGILPAIHHSVLGYQEMRGDARQKVRAAPDVSQEHHPTGSAQIAFHDSAAFSPSDTHRASPVRGDALLAGLIRLRNLLSHNGGSEMSWARPASDPVDAVEQLIRYLFSDYDLCTNCHRCDITLRDWIAELDDICVQMAAMYGCESYLASYDLETCDGDCAPMHNCTGPHVG